LLFVCTQVPEQAVRALKLRELLDDSTPVEDGGVLYFDTAHGIWLYEGNALLGLLEAQAQGVQGGGEAKPGSGGGGAALQEATRAALVFAAQWNACQLVVAGCSRLVKAWRATMTVRTHHRPYVSKRDCVQELRVVSCLAALCTHPPCTSPAM
jgi:hypothetical protein